MRFDEIENVADEQDAAPVVAPTAYFGDRFENKQWYLDDSSLSDLSIDVHSIWDEYTGAGVKVGVIDTQIDFRHTDLAGAYDEAGDFNYALNTDSVTIDPDNLPNYHGTFVAGVISAEGGNNFGTAGIAHGATLVGLGIDYNSEAVVDHILDALNDAVALDVVNNSWRFVRSFADDFRKNAEYEAALVNLVSNGRDGLGTNVVFAAGNTGVSGSANYTNFQNSPYTIAVGSVDADGGISSFSSVGANVLISAAGRDVFSTDLKNRFDTENGTSFSAPAVAATIALMLEANADLGYRDVQQILAYSARREGLSDDVAFGDGWQINGATNHNGGGLHFSDAFGYGFLNVHDAVRLAESWDQQQTFANMTEISQEIEVGQTLRAGEVDSISFDFEIDEALQVEHVQLKMDFRWKNTADIDIFLTSADGTTVRLVYDLPHEDAVGSIRFFEFSSVASMGELAAGTWTVTVVNNDPTATNRDGTPMEALMDEVTLTISGRAENLEDDTYIYTDEFAGELYSGDDLAERSTLRDEDGGVDTLNLAAITSNSVVDLSGVTGTVIAGRTVDIGAAIIENVYAGDGNDELRGSDADNAIHGGRGDDTIYFSGGSDLIDGQLGVDTLVLGSAFSAFSGYVTTVGEVALSLAAGVITLISNVEQFVFTDISLSIDELVGVLSDDGAPEEPVDPTPPEEPVDPTPPEEPEEPVDPTPPEEPEAPADPTPPEEPEVPEEPSNGARTYDNTFTGTEEIETIRGTHDADEIFGLAGDDYLHGRSGDDALFGGAGNDKLKGADGDDWLYGDIGDDRLLGDAGADRLFGGDGDDRLLAGDGDDWLEGGKGADKLKGGEGADIFAFDISDIDALDLVLDFNAAEGDQILILGVDGSSDASFDLVARGRHIYLEMTTAEGAVEVARIQGSGLEGLELSMTDLGLVFG